MALALSELSARAKGLSGKSFGGTASENARELSMSREDAGGWGGKANIYREREYKEEAEKKPGLKVACEAAQGLCV